MSCFFVHWSRAHVLAAEARIDIAEVDQAPVELPTPSGAHLFSINIGKERRYGVCGDRGEVSEFLQALGIDMDAGRVKWSGVDGPCPACLRSAHGDTPCVLEGVRGLP